MRRFIAALFVMPVLGLLLAGCATSPSGKPVVSASKAGADLVQAGNIVQLAAALYETSPNVNATVLAQAQQASSALIAAGDALESSTAQSGDLAANIQLAQTSAQAIVTALQTVDPSLATRAQGYVDTVDAAIALYNLDAPAAGLPTVPVSTTVRVRH